MNSTGWNNLLRGFGVFLGIALLIASWYFSASYFGVQKEELFWVGILVAIVVTFAEFAWRKPGLSSNSTFKAIGLICYSYDIATNTLGILEAWGVSGNWGAHIVQIVMALFVGFIFAVIAEPMLSWGITGDAQADLISGVTKTLNGDNTPDGGFSGGNKNNNQGKHQNQQPRNFSAPEEDDDYFPMDRPVGREARQQMNQHNNHSGGGNSQNHKKMPPFDPRNSGGSRMRG